MKPVIVSLLTIIIASFVLVYSWFSEGFILGVAEAQIPFYDLERFKDYTSWAWGDFNLGNVTGITVASGPTWWFLYQLQNLSLPSFLIQAFVFWTVLISSGLGIYLLSKTLFPDMEEKYLILAVLFYWFNPISLVIVWNRFLLNYIVFFALLPLVVTILIKGLNEKKYIFAIILALTLSLFSYALTAYIFNILIWFVILFTILFYTLYQQKKKFIFFSIRFFLLTFISFIAFNSYWLFSTINFVGAKDTAKEFSQFLSTEGNVYTLTILSQKFGNLIDLLRLTLISFFTNEGPAWARFYNSPLLILLFFIFSGTIFVGLYKLRTKKAGLFLGSFLLLGIFLAKGNNPPFGEIFQFFFVRISLLQVFRDPVEKFGFIVVLAAAPLFAFGVKVFSEVIRSKFKLLIYLFNFFAVLGVLGYPFFTSLVFTSKSPPNDDVSIGYKVKVPDYYMEANNWLESQGRNFRFISFPLGDEGMTYNWEKGYQGVEPSIIIFSVPNISFNTTMPYYSQIVEGLEEYFFKQEDFYKIANLLNVRYFLVRYDIDIGERRLRKPEAVETILAKQEKEGRVKRIAKFGKLIIWENLKWEDRTIYASTNLISAYPRPKISEILLPHLQHQGVLIDSIIDGAEIQKSATIIYTETNIVYQQKQRCFQLIEDFENPKKYIVNIEKSAEFELLLENINIFANEASLAAQLKVYVDNELLQSTSNAPHNDRISYGKVNLTVGKHEISIERPITSNLISKAENLTINTFKGNNQASLKIDNFNPYSRYLVNFDYNFQLGQQFMFLFQQNNDRIRNNNIDAECLNTNILKQEVGLSDFTHVSDIYTPKRSDEAGILFWIDPSQSAELAIKNLSVNRIIEPQPVLINKNPNFIPTQLPSISYTKINPTKYQILVKGSTVPFFLILSELYNGGWEALFEDKTKVGKHFLANSFANGWLIEREGDFSLTLEFAPQRLLDFGRIISGFSLATGLVLISLILFKRKKV